MIIFSIKIKLITFICYIYTFIGSNPYRSIRIFIKACYRGDMILGLNRLSSLMWIFMIKLKAGRYERK